MKKIFNTSQKTPPGRCRGNAQMHREACADVGERFAPADGAAPDAGPKDENRHMLAGVIGAAPCRIIAMIGGDDGEIAWPQFREEFGQPCIKCLKAMRIAGHIAAVTELRVEIEEIGEDQPAVGKPSQDVERRIEMPHVIRALDLLAGKAMPKNIANLADRHDRAGGAGESFEEIAGRRRKAEILAVRSADKTVARAALKGTRDHPADIEGIAEAPRNAAKIIKPLKAEDCFMRGDLKDGVR